MDADVRQVCMTRGVDEEVALEINDGEFTPSRVVQSLLTVHTFP